jgi:NADPH-dependent 2,4-dienoyl-CoA reductase/sulfur reductase-like enzyme
MAMRTELVVVGAGPAGLAAAATAAELGLRVALVDAGERLGGQYFRHDASGESTNRDWPTYLQLEQRIAAQQSRGQLTYLSRSAVWSVSDDSELISLRIRKGERDEAGVEIVTPRLILATGARDRALAFEGWDAPGSITVGGLQSLVKGNHVVAGQRVVIAGTGPFLLATAADVLKAGGSVVAVVEAHSFTGLSANPAALIAGRHKILQAIELLGALRRGNVRLLDRSTIDAALRNDNGSVRSVTVRTPRGNVCIDCDVIATGWGFEPNVELAINLGLATQVGLDGALSVEVDANQCTSNSRIWVAGELAGVAGSEVAVAEGEIAGSAAASAVGRRAADTTEARKVRSRGRRFAKYLLAAYSIPEGWTRSVPNQTTICRCEEVTVGEVRAAIDDFGAEDPRAVKLFTRVGMGWCQGRMCAANCADVIRDCTGVEADAASLASANKRTIAQPISLGTLAEWENHSH